MSYQPIHDIAELCVAKNVRQVVLCPGSRCAPLTLAFTRHAGITAKTFSDERSAGFIALGLAQQSAQPVAMVCTSGTAAYNFAPAVAEAFFSHTPLLVFTADRPAEWIAQHDGQTIFQSDIFGKHVKKSYHLPQDYDHADSIWAVNRIINEAINLARQEPPGPVHINAPFREPLYPAAGETITYSSPVRVIDEFPAHQELTADQREKIRQAFMSHTRILIVGAQHAADPQLVETLETVTTRHHVPVVADVISNLHGIESAIAHCDLFLGQATDDVKKMLQPDLLITFGKSLVSKNLKLFLRKYSPRQHWHIQPGGVAADTFKTVTGVFQTTPFTFFDFIAKLSAPNTFEGQKQSNYHKLWEIEERRATRCLQEFFPRDEFAELELVNTVMQQLPADACLHLANSMSVRYANFIGLAARQKSIRVFANRGTSGIDGSTSTTVGHALSSASPQVLITGDLAFFYDRNAFWHNYPLPNLRVVLLNNHGGLIFNMIDGPASQPEAPEYFITRQKLNAGKLCEEFGFDYLHLESKRKLKNFLKDFFEFDGKTKILELETDTAINRSIFDQLKLKIKKTYEL